MFTLLARRLVASRACNYQLWNMLSGSSQADIPQLMEKLRPLITDKLVHETGVSAVLKLSNTDWTLDLRDEGTIKAGTTDDPDLVLDMKDETFFALIGGSTSTAAAYMTGQLKLEGNMVHALKLSALFKSMQASISKESK